jgi:hypothetical protein
VPAFALAVVKLTPRIDILLPAKLRILRNSISALPRLEAKIEKAER